MKRLLTCFLSLIISCLSLYAQQRKIDSLENLLKLDKEDTNKVNHLITLGYQKSILGDIHSDSEYISKAIQLAQILRYDRGIAYAYKSLGILYEDKNEFDTAVNIYNKALKIYAGKDDKNGAATVLSLLGNVYYETGNYAKAIETEEQTLKTAEETKNKQMEALAMGSLANVYSDEGNYPVALEFDMKAMHIMDSIGNIAAVASVLGNTGNIYDRMNEYDSALKYNFEALKKVESVGDKRMQAVELGNIGSIYKSMKKYPEAIEYEEKGLQKNKEIGNIQGIAYGNGNLADYYYGLGEISKAFTYDSIALKLSEEIGDIESICITSISMGQIYIDQKNYKNAESYLLRGDSLAQTLKSFDLAKDADKNFAYLYTKTGQWQKSNHYLQEYADIKDTLFNQDKSKQVGRLEAKYSYDKQLALQQADAEKNKALADAESKRQKIMMLLFAAIALSVVLIAILIYRSLQSAKKEKILVERQKSVMELKALRAQMNPHFIFNVINSIQHFILKHDSEAAEEHLSEFSKLIRKVLENSRRETISLAEEIKMLELYLELETMRFSSKFKYHISTDTSIDGESIFIPPLIVQPYVENAIWHGLMHLKDKQGEISVRFERVNDSLKCTIDDNGIGRKQAMELKKGALHESIGLSITKERLQIINMLYQAKMSVNMIDKMGEDGIALGTTVELLIPANFNLAFHA